VQTLRNRSRLVFIAALLLLGSAFVPFVTMAASSTPGPAATVALTIIPPRLPADGGAYPAIVVSLVDSSGLPTAAIGNLTVFLSSSQPNIASVPGSVTIGAGEEYVIANATTTTTPGTTQITAHVEGLKSQTLSAPLTTVTPSGYPAKLVVYTSPSTFLDRSDTGVVRVEVVDDAGEPSKAISSIPLSLTSSNSSIASLAESSLTIPAGSFLVNGTFSTSSPGNAVVTAVATGYSSGSALVTVNRASTCTGPCGPYKLSLRLIPGTLPTDGNTYNVLEVSLQTTSGTPAVSSSDIVVQLSSDLAEVASVPSLVTIPAGSISVLAPVTSSALTGVANVTATSAGLIPATISVRTVIPAPSQLQAYIAPGATAYSSYGNYPILVVQLQDSSGNPARARQNTNIIVTSTNSSMLSSYLTLTIPAGEDYVISFLHATGVGTSTLIATSQGLSSSQANLQSMPGPLVVHVSLSSTSNTFIYSNETATFTFTATFDGQPVKNLNVSWTEASSANLGGTITPLLGNTGDSGSTSAVFSPGSYGDYNVTASASSPQTGSISYVYGLLVAQTPQKPTPTLVERIIGYWYYLVAAVAVVAIAVVYLLRMRRKKQRAEIEAGFEVV
jgi:hypothetical protein